MNSFLLEFESCVFLLVVDEMDSSVAYHYMTRSGEKKKAMHSLMKKAINKHDAEEECKTETTMFCANNTITFNFLQFHFLTA